MAFYPTSKSAPEDPGGALLDRFFKKKSPKKFQKKKFYRKQQMKKFIVLVSSVLGQTGPGAFHRGTEKAHDNRDNVEVMLRKLLKQKMNNYDISANEMLRRDSQLFNVVFY